jgi:putative membrane protein
MGASVAGLAQVEMGKLALQQGSANDIKTFAQKMVEDHGRIGQELASSPVSSGSPTIARNAPSEYSAARCFS